MPFPIVLLLFGFPILELAGLIAAGREFGVMAILLWVVLTALIGFQIIRAAGWVTARKVQDAALKGGLPLGALFQAASMVFAGFFLIVPGLVTDVLGLLLLFAPIRLGLVSFFASRASVQSATMGQQSHAHHHGDSSIIDGDFTVVDDPEAEPEVIAPPSPEKPQEKDQ